MSILSDDPLTQLSFSVYGNKGVFALLVGSGLSRAAEIPTGWEITLDLVRRVALAQGVEDQADWEEWYRSTTGEEANYSTLLEELAASPEERRSILHSYIEPTEEDREEGRKLPTAAHFAVADLVRSGYIKVIVTTNFDRLLENALHERCVEPTVVASVDALRGAEPISHTGCYILKLHGDYKDARILNTDAELSGYPPEYDSLLDRIFDEHGLIVCGWSGEWDHALRTALLRAPNRRYSMFWAALGAPNDGAVELIGARKGQVVTIASADGFFSDVWQRVQTLAHSHRQNPLSVELTVGSVKRYLSPPEHRIRLDELISEETDRLLARIDSEQFSPQGGWSTEEFRRRVSLYEDASEPLTKVAGVIGRWGSDELNVDLIDVLQAICTQADRGGGGLDHWRNLPTYPAVLVFTAFGLGLLRARRWGALHDLFSAQIARLHRDPQRVVNKLFLSSWSGDAPPDLWRNLEGLDQHTTPLSDHLLGLFSEWSGSFIGTTPSFEALFEKFEILGGLVYLEAIDPQKLDYALKNYTQVRMPTGRSGRNGSTREMVLEEILSKEMSSSLLTAGFAGGDLDFLNNLVTNYRRMPFM